MSSSSETTPTNAVRTVRSHVRADRSASLPTQHCRSEIKLSARPQHVRVCIGNPTDAAEKADLDGDPRSPTPGASRSHSPRRTQALGLIPAPRRSDLLCDGGRRTNDRDRPARTSRVPSLALLDQQVSTAERSTVTQDFTPPLVQQSLLQASTSQSSPTYGSTLHRSSKMDGWRFASVVVSILVSGSHDLYPIEPAATSMA